jgi:hypothetical protein
MLRQPKNPILMMSTLDAVVRFVVSNHLTITGKTKRTTQYLVDKRLFKNWERAQRLIIIEYLDKIYKF